MRTTQLSNPGRSATAGGQAEEQAPMASRSTPCWPLHVAFGLTTLAFVALYADTFASLVYTWAHDGTFQYAFFIFPICAALVWARRKRLRQLAASPAPAGFVVVIALCVIWLLGGAADINLLRHFAVVALIPALVFTFYGRAIAAALLFPLAYLFFAIPFGDFLVRPLQHITAHLSVFALHFTPVPVYMTGALIYTPASVWHVAAACSGVKFFFATTAFGVLYANLFFQSARRRVIFVICAMVVPVIANGLRVFFTILIGEYMGLHYATGTDHLIFGWQFFGTVLFLLFLAGWPWHETAPAIGRGGMPDPGPQPSIRNSVKLALAGIVFLGFSPAWLFGAHALVATRTGAWFHTPASANGDDPTPVLSATGARFAGADVRAIRTLGSGKDRVAIEYARYDGPPSAGHELITGANRAFDPEVWHRVGPSPATGPQPPHGFHGLRLSSRGGRGARLLWYAYRINDRPSNSVVMAKAWQAWFVLTAQPLYSSAILLSTPVADLHAAQTRLAQAAPGALHWAANEIRQ